MTFKPTPEQLAVRDNLATGMRPNGRRPLMFVPATNFAEGRDGKDLVCHRTLGQNLAPELFRIRPDGTTTQH
jgi:hypothetical protein